MRQANDLAARFEQMQQRRSSGAQASTSGPIPPISSPLRLESVLHQEPQAEQHVMPSAPALQTESSSWAFAQPMQPCGAMFNVSIRPREPPAFTGAKGQDITEWLRQVDDYFALVQHREDQAVAYIILLLQGNARCWWDAECVSRGGHRPTTLAELKMLLCAQFESPVRENRARAELLRLAQKADENASTYMARTKMLLSKVPNYDTKTALQQWILGLRPNFRLEAAKANLKTMAEAEALICRLEDAMEFCRSAPDSGTKQKAFGSGKQEQKKGQKGQQTGGQQKGQKKQSATQKKFFWRRNGQQKQGQSLGGSGQSDRQPNPPQSSGANFHPSTQRNTGSDRSGKGKGNQRRPRMAVMVTSQELRGMADQLDREAAQQAAGSESDDSQRRQGN